MTYSLGLQFQDFSKDALRVYDVVAQIYIKSHSSDGTGRMFITPNCVSIWEFEHEIDRLKQELETIKKEAKKKFEKSDK